MQYETNLQKVEKLLERAEALKLDSEDLPRITLEWFKVMMEADALLDGRTPDRAPVVLRRLLRLPFIRRNLDHLTVSQLSFRFNLLRLA